MRRFAAFGDSITATTSPFGYLNDATLTTLQADEHKSWIPYTTGADEHFVGGFSRGGYRTTQLAPVVGAILVDVAVVMAGTNDIGPAPWGVPTNDSLAAIRTIIVESRTPRALVCAIPPRQGVEATRTNQFNASLWSYVTSMGWTWCDPWVTLRAPDGQWQHSSLTYDGVHPVWQSAQRAGETIRTTMLTMLPTPQP